MKRNIFPQPTGDIELGDYPARIDSGWTNVVWVAVHACNQHCAYCVGWSYKGPPVSLLSDHGVEDVVNRFSRLAEQNGKKLYITISGGEPTMMPELAQFCVAVGKAGHKVELQTNLIDADLVDRFLDTVPPEYVGQIMATYHGWRLDKSDKARAVWMRNFFKAWELGHTIVLKTVVLPGEVEAFPKKKAWLREQLPEGAPILPWVYLRGMPVSLENFNGAYPYSYTPEQHAILDRETEYRKETQRLYRAGSGFYRGMRCDGGRGFVYLDRFGDLFACFNRAQMKPPPKMGNLMEDDIKLYSEPQRCPIHFCSTAFWPLWYGEAPWLFVPGGDEEKASYCRFGSAKKEGHYE